MSEHYITYIDESGLRLGEDVTIQWLPNGDFVLRSPHVEHPLLGTSDAAVQNALGLVAPLVPALRHLDSLPRGEIVQLSWQTPPWQRDQN